MSFELVDVNSSVGGKRQTGMSAGLVKLRNAPALLRVTMREVTFAAFGFNQDDRFVLLIGRDEDHGMIRLRKDRSGQIKPLPRTFSGGARAYQFNLGRRNEYVDRAHKAEPVNFEQVDPATVEIVLPSWADETSERRPARIALKPSAQIAAEKEHARLEREKREAEERRRSQELEEVAKEAARQTREQLAGDKLEFRDGLKLTGTEAELLSVLVQKAGKTVSKETLYSMVWGMSADPVDSRIVDVMICKVRAKLPVTVSLKTLHGQGYKLTGAINDLMEPQGGENRGRP